jgi:hypothetical protein
MSSQLYPTAREKFLTAQLNWMTGVYRAILLPEAYTPNFDNEFVSDIFEGVRLAVSDPIGSRTATDGVAGCASIRFGVLVDTRKASKMVIYRDTGLEATSDLVLYLDSENLQGAPLDLVGFEYFYTPNSLDGGIFRL